VPEPPVSAAAPQLTLIEFERRQIERLQRVHEREIERQDDLLSQFLDYEVDGHKLSREDIAHELVAATATNWAHDPFARGAYSWATPRTRAAQAILARSDGLVLFSGEALYRGADMGTVEAALASGLETAGMILRG